MESRYPTYKSEYGIYIYFYNRFGELVGKDKVEAGSKSAAARKAYALIRDTFFTQIEKQWDSLAGFWYCEDPADKK